MKFSCILSDPAWEFSDALKMSSVKRGASSNYKTMTVAAICDLKVKELAADNALLVLWCPSSLLKDGLTVMETWGFDLKQTVCWVKLNKHFDPKEDTLDDGAQMLMGRYFRNSHELALVGTRGKIASEIENHSMKSVIFAHNLGHSVKPKTIHERLELMLPTANKLELFARSVRANWTTIGNQCPSSKNEDIRKSIERLLAK
jgi:N6-adenosine-specific RNA methylase IME4